MTDPTSLPAFAPNSSDDTFRGRVLDSLVQEGYRPEVDEDGDVAVRVQGQQLFVRCMDTIPPLVRVFGQWLIGDDVPQGELVRLRAANAVVGALNLIKATVVEDRLVIAADLLVTDAMDLRSLLGATMDAVLGSVQMWQATVLEYSLQGD